MLINLKVKTLDAQTHEFSIDNELTVREFKDKVAEKTNIAADQQRIIYCGRVMVDDKQLKEYDVDGKVVHVAERPPPSQRLPTPQSSGSNANPQFARRTRARPDAGGMRNSPLFRALDGMVVGTMAFPMNANTNGQAPVNPFAASSSFCMNRITVARHMLECANNIAAFLEDPSRGLNNQSLDILARGRWTMESTVVEVGITSDIPQSQQIVEMVQGAVQAALRRSGNTNVTLVQLPTVYSSNENEGTNAAATAAAADAPNADVAATVTDATAPAEEETAANAAAAVLLEDDIDDDEGTPTNEQSDNNSTATSPTRAAAAATAGADNENAASATNDEGTTDNSRRRTGTPVLAGVIEQMRNVQNRLNPFIQQYYELLQNEPVFEEDDTEGRVNAQRLFDRVSEAFHYMSHAQHAISDLMLDVSQGSPRYLTCRPILVEQSGYVSSNNFLTPAMLPAALRQHQQQQQQQQQPRNTASNNTATAAAPSAAATADSTMNNSNNATTTANTDTARRSASISGSSTSSTDANNSSIDDPIDEPVTWPPTINFGAPSNDSTTNAANATTNAANANSGNFQRQVARLLQDVVSAAPFDTEFHVHFNSPNVVSIDVPIGISGISGGGSGAAAAAAADQANSNQTATTSTSTNNSENNTANATATATTATTNDNNVSTNTTTNSSSSTASNATNNPARVTTATLPTTSTQTRSTSRPQVHIGNIPVLGMPTGWNGRVLPNNNVSSFDRFLPCNSHHIREPENANNANNENGSNSNGSTTAPNNRGNPAMANIVTRRPLRTVADILPRIRTPTMRNRPRLANNNAAPEPPLFSFDSIRNRFLGIVDPPTVANNSNLSSTSSSTSTGSESANQDAQRLNIHKQLKNCINNQIFEGKPINNDTLRVAINRAMQWFGESLLYLPQYEKPEYDSRDSVLNIVKNTLPIFVELIETYTVCCKEFEQRLKKICDQFRKRLYSVLYVCVGRDNAEIFWVQLMRLLSNSAQENLHSDIVEFLGLYLTPNIPSATDEADAQQFIVVRNSTSTTNNVQMTFVSPPSYFHPQPMDTDVEMTEATANEIDDEPLPPVVAGSATWHRNFPNDWLPIITRDIQRQTENPINQPPYSDAYISGMSSKRRKLIQHSKPPTEIGAIIADSVSKAIHNTGLGTTTTTTTTSFNQNQTSEDIARAIASDAAVQTSCTDALRTNVRERLKKDPDFEADKFPKSNKFIQK